MGPFLSPRGEESVSVASRDCPAGHLLPNPAFFALHCSSRIISPADRRARKWRQMDEPVLYGAAYSVYVRAVRLALAEKGVAYRLEEVDVFGPEGVPAAHRARHPFGRIPPFQHDRFRLYESGPISRYVDQAFAGPSLWPAAPRSRARLNH